jgi:predicted MFS family arabinose efflux permease
VAALVLSGGAEVWSLAVLSGVTGAATGFFNPASTGLLPAVVPAERLQEANGLRATGMAGGEIAGPAIAGVLVAATSPGWALAIDAATFAASAALLAALRPLERVPREATTFVEDLRDGWGAFRSRTWVWAFVLGAAVGNAVWGAWSVLGPVVAERELGGAGAWGAVMAAFGAGALAGGLIAIRVDPRRPLVVATLTIATCTAPLALLASGSAAAPLGVAAALAGAGMMLGNSLWESTLQRGVPRESLSRVSAYDWFGSFAIQPVGLAIWGPIAALIGIDASLWLAAALLLAMTAVLLLVRDIRRPFALLAPA